MDDRELDALFDTARAQTPPVPEALVARVLAGARSAQAGALPAAPWRRVLRALGGAPGLGGLITAGCVGFWLGVAPPQGLPDLAGLMLDDEITTDLVPDLYGWDIEEG